MVHSEQGSTKKSGKLFPENVHEMVGVFSGACGPAGAHWAKMGLIFPRTPFPSENSLYSKVKQIASFEK